MRNLKKILALVLAMVMTFSVMATANAFTDDADIDATYEEATAVLAGLKVFEGRETGAFDPKAPITRAEVAAIIYRIVTGDVEKKQVSIYADYNKFDDVKSTSWYAGYVNFCANGELIQGYGNGKFGPDDQVTGYQALAMIQRALGYDQNGEFTGAGWEIRTASNAQELGILKNITAGTLGAPATREVVAEILFQAMLCSTVDYTMAFNYRQTGTTLMDGFGAKKVAGVITDTEIADGTTTMDDAYTVETTGRWGQVVSTPIDVTVSKTDADWTKVGYAAYVWVTGLNTTAKTAKAFTKIFVTGTELSVTTDGTTVADMTNKDKSAYVASSDKSNLSDLAYFENGEVDTNGITNVIGSKIALVDNNNNGKVDTVVATNYTPAKVTNVLERTISGDVSDYSYDVECLNGGTDVILAKDLMGVEALEEGDYITYVEVDGDAYVTMAGVATGEFDIITKATVGGATVKAYTVEGEKYVASKLTGSAAYADMKETNLNKTVVVVTDEYGYMIAGMLYSDPAAYLLVLDNEDSHGVLKVAETSVAYTDGSVAEIDVAVKSEIDDNDLVTGINGGDGNIYSYELNKAGNTVLTDVADNVLYNINYSTDEVEMSGTRTENAPIFASVSVKLSKTSKIVDLRDVLAGDAEVGTVYTGYSEIPSLDDATIIYLSSENATITLAFLVDGDDAEDLRTSFVVFDTTINDVEKLANGEYTYTLKAGVLVKGELVENYVLSEAQYEAIDTYGVGVYTFGVKGQVATYTSFAEDTVRWEPMSSGDVIYGINNITDTYTSIILDISKGKVNAWDRYVVDGTYYAWLDTVNKIVYVVGDATEDETDATKVILATAGAAGTGVVLDGIEYWPADGLVTAWAEVVAAPAAPVLTIVESVENATAPASVTIENGTAEFTLAADDYYEFTAASLTATVVNGGAVAQTLDNGDIKFTVTGLTDSDSIVITGAAATAIQYTITFDTDGGSPVDSITGAYGAPVTAPSAPTKTGYTFAGWDVEEFPETMPAEDITITALWTINEYTLTVKYYYNNVVAEDTFTGTYEHGAEYSVAIPEKDGLLATIEGAYATKVEGTMTGNKEIEVKYVDEVNVTIDADAVTTYTVTPETAKANIADGTVEVTFKWNRNFTKNDTLVFEYTINGEAGSAETVVTTSMNEAVFTVDLGEITGDIEIVISGNMHWKV